MRTCTTTQAKDKGVALIAVTALALVIVVLSLGLTRESRVGVRVAAALIAQTQAAEAAKSVELWTALRLAAQLAEGPQSMNSQGAIALDDPHSIAFDGRAQSGRAFDFSATVSVQAERGKVDLLSAEPDLVRQVLAGSGIPDARRLAEHVEAVRAERAQSISWRMNDRPINNLGELAMELGWNRVQLARLRTIATLHGNLSSPDPLLAPADVFAALEFDDDTRRIWQARRSAERAPMRFADEQTFMISTEVARADGVRHERLRRATISPDGGFVWGPLLD